MKIERPADQSDPLIARIDNDSEEYPGVALVDHRSLLDISEMTIEIGELRLQLSEAIDLIARLQAAVKIAEEEAPRRYPYNRRGERPAADVLGVEP
jgi:hypothetical protein